MKNATGMSLHIGVNSVDPKHYAGWSGPLTACEYDAEDMKDIARNLGYESRLLLTQDATRDKVISTIRDFADALGEGDIFFLTYSGHGGQVPDTNGDERDLRDETWCLYDGELIDDELKQIWAGLRTGVRVAVLSDSCHSGTVTRMRDMSIPLPDDYLAAIEDRPVNGPKCRMMPVAVARATYRANREFYDGIQESSELPHDDSTIAARIRLISGCQDNQLSLDGAFNGLFTGTLKRVYAGGTFQGNYEQFHREIAGQMPPTQTPNHFVIGGTNDAFDKERPFQI